MTTEATKTNNYAHIHVLPKCVDVIVGFHVLRVDVSLDLGISRCHWCRTSHRSAGSNMFYFTSTSFHHAYAIPNTKFFLLGVVVRLVSLSSSTQSVSQILAYFTSRKKRSFEVLSLQKSCTRTPLVLRQYDTNHDIRKILYKPLNLCFPSVYNF